MFDGFYDMTVAIWWGFLAAARRAMIIQKKRVVLRKRFHRTHGISRFVFFAYATYASPSFDVKTPLHHVKQPS